MYAMRRILPNLSFCNLSVSDYLNQCVRADAKRAVFQPTTPKRSGENRRRGVVPNEIVSAFGNHVDRIGNTETVIRAYLAGAD